MVRRNKTSIISYQFDRIMLINYDFSTIFLTSFADTEFIVSYNLQMKKKFILVDTLRINAI